MIETGNWGTGFQAEINISNLTDKLIEAWELSFDGNFAIEEIWNAKLISEEENTYKTAGLEGNTAIQPDSSVKFGIRAEKEEDIQPVIENIVFSEMLIDDNFTSDSEEERDDSDDGIYCKELSEDTPIVQKGDGLPYVANQLLVMADDSVSFEDMEAYAAGMNAEIVGYIRSINKYQLEFADIRGEKLKERIEKFKSDPLIKNVSHNYVFEIGEDSVPDDPKYALYNLENNTKSTDWNLYAINAFRAWDYYDKMIPVKIGVVDSTFDENHDDLSFKKVWGKFRNMGYDFLGINGHGTHVAGIMAAGYNDNEGIAGICPKSEVYAYSMGNSNSVFKYMSALSQLIQNDNVKVINVSMAVFPEDTSMNITDKERKIKAKLNSGDEGEIRKYNQKVKKINTTLQRLINKGYDFVIVVAAGNDGNIGYNAKYANYLSGIDGIVKCNIIVVNEFNFPKCTKIGMNAFSNCYQLKKSMLHCVQR